MVALYVYSNYESSNYNVVFALIPRFQIDRHIPDHQIPHFFKAISLPLIITHHMKRSDLPSVTITLPKSINKLHGMSSVVF